MNISKVRLAAPVLVVALVFLAAVFCGCEESYTERKADLSYLASESDLAFQEGADRPPTLRTLYSTASVLIAQGRDEQAEILLLRIISENPKFIPAYNDLAELKMRHRRIDEAIKILSKGLEVYPSEPVLLNNLGMCWMIRKDYEKALSMFTKAAGVKPQNTRYRGNMAVALGLLGRDEESLALYRQILPEDQARHNLSVIRDARRRQLSNSDTIRPEQYLNRQ